MTVLDLKYLILFAEQNNLMNESLPTVSTIIKNYLDISSDLYGVSRTELMELAITHNAIPVLTPKAIFFSPKAIEYYKTSNVEQFWAGYNEWQKKLEDSLQDS